MLCLSRTCRNSFASFPMLCSSGNGSVSRWQGQLYCLVIWGRAAPLLLLWVLLWERTVLNLHPLLTCIWYISSSGTQQVTLDGYRTDKNKSRLAREEVPNLLAQEAQ